MFCARMKVNVLCIVMATVLVSVVSATDTDAIVKRLEAIEGRENTYLSSIADLKQELQSQGVKIRQLEQESQQKDDVIASQNTRIDALVQMVEIFQGASPQVQIINSDNDDDSRADTGVETPSNSTDTSTKGASQPGPGRGRNTRKIASTVRQQSQMKESGVDKRLLMDAATSNSVAFHAICIGAEQAHLGKDQNIVFETEMLNVGGGYHAQHGIFIAPVAGIYVFSASIMSYHNPRPEVQVNLVKNGNILARVYGHGYAYDIQGSVTVAVQLVAGDEVWAENRNVESSIWGDRFTSFTGFLIASL